MITPWNPAVIVNDTTSGTQTNPQTTTLNNGNFVVTWEDTSADTIHFKIYDPAGDVVLSEQTVENAGAEDSGSLPSIVTFNGGFAIAHQAVNPINGINTSVITTFNDAGTETGELVLTAGATQELKEIDLFELSGGGFGAVGINETTLGIDVYIYDNAGVLVNTTQVGDDSAKIVTNVNTSAAHPQAVQLTNGEIAVVWENSSATEVVLVDSATGVPTGTATTLGGDIYGVPKVIAGPSGTLMVAYTDWSAGQFGSSEDATIVHLTSSLDIFTEAFSPSPSFTGSQAAIEIVAMDNQPGYVAMWFDETDDVYYARSFDWYGNALSVATPFAADANGAMGNGNIQEQISATVLEDGRIAISFQTGGLDGDTSGVGMMILDARQGVVNGTTSSEILYGGNGIDIINSSSGDDTVYGEGGNDYIYDALESTSADLLAYGGTGDDHIIAGAGEDSLFGERGNDVLYGGSSVDEIYGGNDDDYINAGDGDDLIVRGNNGSDILDGGAGRDYLGGGPAADTFVFSTLTDSATNGLRDRILDFEQGADKIDVELIDANSNTASDDAFTFIGTSSFSGTAGEMMYLTTASKTIVQVDSDGDGSVDMSFELSGVYVLTENDFFL